MEGIIAYTQSFFGWLLQTTLIASLVICMILLIQKVLGRKLGPRWSHALWLILLIRMVLPWSPSSRVSLSNLIPSWEGRSQSQQLPDTGEPRDVYLSGQAVETSEAVTSREPESSLANKEQNTSKPATSFNVKTQSGPRLFSVRRVLAIIWLAGAIVIGIYLLVSDLALWRIVKRERPLVNQSMLELFEECKTQMGIQSLVVVVPSEQVRSPGLFGFVRPRLLLPKKMLDDAKPEELRYVFLHELAHLKRHDIYIGWLTSLLQVLHWFNPLVWIAFYRMRTDRELACDALVLTRTGQDKSQEYGGAIVDLLHRFSRPRYLPAMAGIVESKSQLKRRITMITQFKNKSYRFSPLAAVLIIVLACISLPNTKNNITLGGIISGDGSHVTLRRIMEHESYYSNISPDGNYLCYQEWNNDNSCLCIFNLLTGSKRILVSSDPNSGSIGWGEPSISIDNKMVAYRWWDNDRNTYDLQVIGINGNTRHTLVKGHRIFPKKWSIDGKKILGLRPTKEDEKVHWDFVWVSTENDSVISITILPEERGVTTSRVDLSPDNRYIAYDARNPKVALKKYDIFLFDMDKNVETALQYPGNNRLIGWTPDGKHILFTNDRNVTQDLLLMPISNGKSVGKPKLIRRDIKNFRPIGLTQDGSCYYTNTHRFNTVHTAVLNLDTGKLLSTPKPIMEGQDSYGCITWSPDGKYLTYCQRREDDSSDIHIRPLSGGVERVINTGLPLIRWISWDPTGKSIIVSFLSPGGGGSTTTDMIWSVCQIDVETGEKSILFKSDVGRPIRSEFSPDGKRIIYNCVQAKPHDSLVIRDLETGKERKIFEFSEQSGWKYWWDLSPDGNYIAIGAPGVNSPSQLKIISIEGKELEELLPQDWGRIYDVIWAPDGKTVLFTSQDALWQISAEGGEPSKLLTSEQLGVASRPSVCIHPDGQHLAYITSQYNEELWVMENFLPKATVAKTSYQPNFRKIQIPTRPGGGVLSPDGNKLAFVYEGSLWIVPVHGKVSPDIAGEPVRLTEPMGAWDVASMLAWSADGKWIAFNVSDEKEDAIYVIASSGGKPRRVPVETRLRNSIPNYRLSLSPDGKVVAFSSRYIDESGAEPPEESGLPPSVRGFFIYTVSVAGGELKRLTDSASGEPAFSPDGKKIAFVKYFISEQGQLYGSLWVVPATGGSPIQVSDSGPLRRVCGPVWSPDGKMIAFTVMTPSERKEVCIIPVSEAGMALASPTKIRLPLNTLDMLAGWTHDNKIGVFLHKPGQWAINTVPASGGQAVQVTPSGSAAHPRWSPDGQRIYFRWDGGQMASVPSGGGELSVGPFNRDETFYLIYPGSGNAVSPNGKEIVFCAGKKVSEDNKKPYWEVNIYTISLEGGEPKKITEGRYPCWSPDGKSIAFIRTYQRPVKSESGWNIYIVPSKGGEVRQLTSDSDDVRRTHIDFSPDGKSIAYFARDKTIRVIPVQGGESRIVARAEELRNHDELGWSPDGGKLVYSSKGCIWVVSSEGGEPKEIRTGLDAKAGHVSWSPDGKKLAFTAITSGEEDLYFIENFLSEAPVAKPSYHTNFKKIQIPIDRLRPDAPLSPDGRNIAFVFNKKLWVMPRVGNAGPDFPGTPRLLETGDIKVSWGGEAWSGDSSWIAFHDTDQWNEKEKRWGNRAVYVISVDGGEPKEVYEDWSYGDYLVNVRMSLSPDGKILAFSSVDANEQHIYTIDVEGGLPRRITEAPSREPVFSPDGKMIAYVEDKNFDRAGGGLWIVPSDGGVPKLLAEAGNATSPVWSPDGRMIAFLDQKMNDKIFIIPIHEDGEQTIEKITVDCPNGIDSVVSLTGWTPDNKLGTIFFSDPQDGLYTLPATGGIATLVTNEKLHQPRWSPDGKRIIGTVDVGEGKEGWKYYGLASVSAEGGEISIIPVRADSKIIKLSYSGGNHVSPDGRNIVFAGRKENEPEGINHILTIPIEGGEPKQLTNANSQQTDWFPCWSPDGKNIAFMRRSKNELIEENRKETNIYIISADGGEPRQLTQKSDKVLPYGYIAWSLDGKWISYFSTDMEIPNSELTLNVIPAEGGASRVVGKPVGSFDVRIESAWSPDSKQIAIVHKIIKIISLDDGSIEEIDTHLADTKISYLDWTDNGNRLVFSGRQGGELEFWTVENFLPEEISRQP